MSDWLEALHTLGDTNTPCVVVSVARAKGSTPGEVGTKLVVGRDTVFGTIGGGTLEFEAIEIARQMLQTNNQAEADVLRRFPLGPRTDQCCGGVVDLFFETVPAQHPKWVKVLIDLRRDDVPCVMISVVKANGAVLPGDKLLVTKTNTLGSLGGGPFEAEVVEIARTLLPASASADTPVLRSIKAPSQPSTEEAVLLLFESFSGHDLRIVLFGAGHIGKALVTVLSGLPCRITWVDNRQEQFPVDAPSNVMIKVDDHPENEVERAAPNSCYLVMTHSHALDLRICQRILMRDDFRYFGLIGSASKRKRFEKQLRDSAISRNALQRMACPIGIRGISGKHPSAIAIAIAAEVLRIHERAQESERTARGRFMPADSQASNLATVTDG